MFKNKIKHLLRNCHSCISQIFLAKTFVKEYQSFRFISKSNSNMISIELSPADKKFIHETWINFHEEINDEVIRHPNFFFFNKKSMIRTMTSDSFNADYIGFLRKAEQVFNKEIIKTLSIENNIGGARILFNSIFNNNYGKTSITRAVHIYQLSKLYKTIKNLNKKNITILEWGGGYGGLANVLWKLKEFENYDIKITYIIIDIPASIWIQNLYLKSIIGQNEVNIAEHSGSIEEGKINLLKTSVLEKFNLKSDIFISAWAISESNNFSQNYTIEKNFFEAYHILLFHQLATETHPFAEYLTNHLKNNYDLIDNEEVPVVKNQYYISVKR